METALSYDVRGTFEVRNDLAVGWCWSQQRPGEALRVEVLSDGQVVASGIAARLVLDLVRPGVTDGYHGYLLILPKDLPQNTFLEAREARTGKVFARQLPKTQLDVMAWQQRVAQLGGAIAELHDQLSRTSQDEARWSAAWGASGALLNSRSAGTKRPGPPSGLALRPIADPVWTVILDLPRAGASMTEAKARWEVAQLAPLLVQARAELVVIDDGQSAAFLTSVAGLRFVTVSFRAGEVERLAAGLSMAKGAHVLIFAPARTSRILPHTASDRLRDRAALLAEQFLDKVLIGGGAAASVRGAGLRDLLPLVERARTETGLLLRAPRVLYDTVGVLDVAMDDGADLALLDFALRARVAGISVHILDEALSSRSCGLVSEAPRRAFAQRWLPTGPI